MLQRPPLISVRTFGEQDMEYGGPRKSNAPKTVALGKFRRGDNRSVLEKVGNKRTRKSRTAGTWIRKGFWRSALSRAFKFLSNSKRKVGEKVPGKSVWSPTRLLCKQ